MSTSFIPLFFLTAIWLLSHPVIIFAQAVNIPQEFFRNHAAATSFRSGSIGNVISLLLPNAMVIAGVFFVFLILYGGYQYVIHSGQMDSPQIAQKAHRTMTQGAIGLLLVVAAYFILQIISTVTGINFINTPVT